MAFWGNFGFNFNMYSFFAPQTSVAQFAFPSFQELWSSFFIPLRNFKTYIPSVINTQTFLPAVKKSVKIVGKKDSNTISIFDYPKIKLPSLSGSLDGYNVSAGERLAKIALNKAVGWTGYCARYVKNAIEKAGLGLYECGHAFQMPSILRRNKNFKEISPDTVDVSKLPAGCILVYGKGKAGYSSSYGHTEITTGDGRAVSDGITKNLHKKPTAIFMPVEHNYLA